MPATQILTNAKIAHEWCVRCMKNIRNDPPSKNAYHHYAELELEQVATCSFFRQHAQLSINVPGTGGVL